MGIPRSCQLRILSIYRDLKSAERRAVDLLLDKPAEIPSLTIGEYARRAGCSEATVVRLSKRLGYAGFPELKLAFDGEPSGGTVGDFQSVNPTDDPITVAVKVTDSAIAGLTDTLSILDREAYVAAVDAIVAARKLVFCGLGDGYPVAVEACQRFDRVGQPCWAPVDADQQLVLATNLGRNNVLVAISHSGRSTTILDAMEAAAESGATVVAITNFPGAPVARRADIVLQTAVFTTDWSGETVSKRIAQLSIVESLFANFMIRRGPETVNTLRHINKVVRVHKRNG